MHSVVLKFPLDPSKHFPLEDPFVFKICIFRLKARWPGSPSVMADMVAATLPQLSVEERQQVGVLTTILVFKGLKTVQTVCVNYI